MCKEWSGILVITTLNLLYNFYNNLTYFDYKFLWCQCECLSNMPFSQPMLIF